MKNLKVKSILFSLMAILMLSVLMTSCEQTLQEDILLDQPNHLTTSCFFDNACLHTGNSNIKEGLDALPTDLEALHNYLKQEEQKQLVQHIETNFGIPFWGAANVDSSDESIEKIGFVPIINEQSSVVETIMLVRWVNDINDFQFQFVERDEIDAYPTELDLTDRGNQSLTKEETTLLFLKFDNLVFGQTNDPSFTEKAKLLFNQYAHNNSEVVSRNTICYAVLNEVITDWYQYNPMTDTWVQISSTNSYQWGDLCIDVGFDPTDGTPTNPGGGSSSGSTISSSSIFVYGDYSQTNDPIQKLDCFQTSNNSSGNHSITIYVDQPVRNSNSTYTTGAGNGGSSKDKSDVDVGHTFINLTQTINGSSRSLTFGFYPLGGVSPTSPNANGVFGDDGGHVYDVSITQSISPSQFTTIVNGITSMHGNYSYNLNTRNCSDFGIEAFELIGTNLPDSYGFWLVGGGTNPGHLGQGLRSMNLNSSMSRNTNGGIAKTTSNCN